MPDERPNKKRECQDCIWGRMLATNANWVQCKKHGRKEYFDYCDDFEPYEETPENHPNMERPDHRTKLELCGHPEGAHPEHGFHLDCEITKRTMGCPDPECLGNDRQKSPIEIGTRVRVISPDKKEDWGMGTITKVEPLYMVNDDDEPEYKVLLIDVYPSEITLDDGRITEGMKCWWAPLKNVRR